MAGGLLPRLGRMNPLRLLPINTAFDYEKLSGTESRSGSPYGQISFKKYRWRSPSPGGRRFPSLVKMSLTRLVMLLVTAAVCIGLIVVGAIRGHRRLHPPTKPEPEAWPWENFTRLNGIYNGVSALVPFDKLMPEQEYIRLNRSDVPAQHKQITGPPLDPLPYDPYEKSTADKSKDLDAIVECFLDAKETVRLPQVFAYPGVPQNFTENLMGSYKLLGLREDVCFDRFGRFGPYGYGYGEAEGGVGLADKSEKVGVDKIWKQQKKIDYRGMDWGDAQRRCYKKNAHRFKDYNATEGDSAAGLSKKLFGLSSAKSSKKGQSAVTKKGRQAYILRAYTGYKYDDHQLLSLRAMITELALKSGGEYDVHLLVQIRDDSIPIWTDKEVYRKTLEKSVPKEFWGITTLWSEQLMRLYYPAPFPGSFENPSGQSIHGVYRGAHFPLFWFAQQHPEYDFYWNWEMDLRYTGHYYEFNRQITQWAKKQPRKGLWERNAQYFIPAYHGTWENFTKSVEKETIDSSVAPIWGPPTFEHDGISPPPNETYPKTSWFQDKYEWGVGEEADFISFNPLFDPSKSSWVFRNDIDGFSRNYPMPPRRAAIITVSRLSKRLLDIAHNETYQYRHTMFPEMWPPTIALQHGLKAVYAPHPVYFDRNWPLEYLDQVFNHPNDPSESVFGGGEHNHLGSSFYYNSGFSGALWRRWFGYMENSEGGSWTELTTTGRMCLKSILFHPIKYERGPTE